MKFIMQKPEGKLVKIAWSYLHPFFTDSPTWRTDRWTDVHWGNII